MKTRTVGFLAVIALTVFLPTAEARAAHRYQEKKADAKAAPGVAGRWTVSVKGSPHGDVTMGLDVAQEGKKVTGTLATPHGDNLQIEGEFVGGALALATPGGGDAQITMKAKLKDDGTLDGYLEPDGRHDLDRKARIGKVERSLNWTDSARRDVRHAWRMIARMPVPGGDGGRPFTGVGIGVNVVIFSWIQAVVFQPIPGVAGAASFNLVEPRTETGMNPGTSWPEYRDLRERLHTFRDLLAFRMTAVWMSVSPVRWNAPMGCSSPATTSWRSACAPLSGASFAPTRFRNPVASPLSCIARRATGRVTLPARRQLWAR